MPQSVSGEMGRTTTVLKIGKRRGFIGIAVAVMLLATSSGIWRNQTNQVSAELEAIRSAGDPVSLAEVVNAYQYPSSHDSTDLWLAAFSLLQSTDEEDSEILQKLPFVGFADEPSEAEWNDIELADEYFHKQARVIDLLDQAARFGGRARFPIDVENGSYVLMFPSGFIDAHSLLRLETNLHAFRSDANKTADAICTRFAMALSLKNHPDGSSQSLRQAVDGVALEDFVKFLSKLSFSDDDLLRIQSAIRDAEYIEVLELQLLSLQAEGISLFQDARCTDAYLNTHNEMVSSLGEIATKVAGLSEVRWHDRVVWWFTRQSDCLLFLKTTKAMIAASRTSWPDALDRAKQIERNLDSRLKSLTPQGTYLLTSMKVKRPSALFEKTGKYTARNRVHDAAIAVELYRRKTGTLPATLDNVVPVFLPAIPVDPFSGNAVHYVTHDGRFVVYSVGHDGIDNGGNGGKFGLEPDVTCCVSFPQADDASLEGNAQQ